METKSNHAFGQLSVINKVMGLICPYSQTGLTWQGLTMYTERVEALATA